MSYVVVNMNRYFKIQLIDANERSPIQFKTQ